MRTLLALAALLATAASAQPRQFGSVQYSVPDGWRQADYDGYAGAVAEDGSTARFLVFAGEPAPGRVDVAGMADWLGTRTHLWAWGDVETVATREIPIERPDGLPAAALVVLSREDGRTRFALHAAVLARGRLEHVALVARSQEGLQEHIERFEAWVGALTFADAEATALASGAEPGELDGVFVGIGAVYGLNGPSSGLRYYVFTREGWFADDLPEGTGLADYDPRRAASTAPDEVGTYRVRGGTLLLRYADGDTDEIEFSGGGARIQLDGSGYTRVAVPEDGTRFDGTFRYGQYIVTENVGQSSARSYENTIRLGRDGRFSTTEASFFSAQGGTYNVSSGDGPREVRGTYAVRGGALVLTPEAGPPSTLSLLRHDGDLLILDGDAYHRVRD